MIPLVIFHQMYPKKIILCVKLTSLLQSQSILFFPHSSKKLGKIYHCLFSITFPVLKNLSFPETTFFRLTARREFAMSIICHTLNLSPFNHSCLIFLLLYQEFTFLLAFVSLVAKIRTLRDIPL